MSIIHEFPDPNSLDPNNWQGFSLDDDIVVTHGQTLKENLSGDWYNPATQNNSTQLSLIYATVAFACITASFGLVRMVGRAIFRKRNGYTGLKK